jgi:hypothetical protein
MSWSDPDEYTHRFDRDEDGFPCETFAASQGECEAESIIDEEGEDFEAPDESVCLLRYNLVVNAPSCGAMMDSVKLHERTCAACGRVENAKLELRTGIVPEAA